MLEVVTECWTQITNIFSHFGSITVGNDRLKAIVLYFGSLVSLSNSRGVRTKSVTK